jgi:hypothetical protein
MLITGERQPRLVLVEYAITTCIARTGAAGVGEFWPSASLMKAAIGRFIGRVTGGTARGYDVPHGGQHPCGRAASIAAARADASGDPGSDRQAGFGRAG